MGRVYSYNRKKQKEYLLNLLGNVCSECGSSKNIRFHHTDPNTKSYNIGESLGHRPLSALEQEARKCVLLCAKCHRSHHAVFKHSYSAYRDGRCDCSICREKYLEYYKRANSKRRRCIKSE